MNHAHTWTNRQTDGRTNRRATMSASLLRLFQCKSKIKTIITKKRKKYENNRTSKMYVHSSVVKFKFSRINKEKWLNDGYAYLVSSEEHLDTASG